MPRTRADRDADDSGAEVERPRKRRDPLGKLQNRYEIQLGQILGFCGGIAVLGLISLFYGLLQDPKSLLFLAVGGVVLLLAVALLAINLPNLGRRLEIRRSGIRYTAASESVEMFWDEITVVDVDRTDDTYLGLASVHETSSDAIRPSGPLTKTEFNVMICTADGRSIRLSKRFLQMVPRRQELVREIQVRAGLK
jgi:hypothetical protein